MIQTSHASNISSRQHSKPVMFIALIFAMCLPFILIKIFPHKQIALSHKLVFNQPPTPTIQPQTQREETSVTMISKIITAKTQQSGKKIIQTESHGQVKKNPDEAQWRTVTTQSGDSLALIFKRLGIPASTLPQLLKDVPETKQLAKIKPNQTIKFFIQKQKLEKIILPYDQVKKLLIVYNGKHFETKVKAKKITTQQHFVTATIHGSLFKTAKRKHISFKLVQQMTQIFAWDINFARDLQDGDQFTMIYKATYAGNEQVRIGDIQAVSFRNKGKLFSAIRHTPKSTGQTEYFTPEGMSAQKAFDRYPIRFSHISSTFSLSRYHPILHYNRAHHGVDLAARIGTPIQATGAGRIDMIGHQGGYGNVIKINHSKSYSTVYGHMLKFQKGLSRGSYVRRGQIIGYVGQSGLASGPHCHYEFRVNEQPKNPSTVLLPRSIPLSGRELAAFHAKASMLIAQMKRFEKKQMTG